MGAGVHARRDGPCAQRHNFDGARGRRVAKKLKKSSAKLRLKRGFVAEVNFDRRLLSRQSKRDRGFAIGSVGESVCAERLTRAHGGERMNLVEPRADSAQRQKHGRRFETRRLGVEHSLRAHKAGKAWEDDAIKAEAGSDRARMLSARAAERNQ